MGTDLEWKLIYVGSAEDETYDQLLESVLVGPVNVGNYRFVLQASFMLTDLLNSVLQIAIAYKLKLFNAVLVAGRSTRPIKDS